jgi:hypothetical protein
MKTHLCPFVEINICVHLWKKKRVHLRKNNNVICGINPSPREMHTYELK